LRATPYARALPRREQTRLRELTALFLCAKTFEPAHGLTITETMRALVGLKACVPILNLGLKYYDTWSGIVMYPGDFRVHDQYLDETGVEHHEIRELCGQSLTHGPMVLSWDTIREEAASAGYDLVIHECAHKLDARNGAADGFPSLHPGMSATEWTRDFRTAFERLGEASGRGWAGRLDPYAATDPAEFFAVVSEAFFTAPGIVYEEYPRVYRQLTAFYRQDPYALLHEEKGRL
jgi:Mlc titration factor MtfA (ptsG expression regulator)